MALCSGVWCLIIWRYVVRTLIVQYINHVLIVEYINHALIKMNHKNMKINKYDVHVTEVHISC
jgi:hypothetical protein